MTWSPPGAAPRDRRARSGIAPAASRRSCAGRHPRRSRPAAAHHRSSTRDTASSSWVRRPGSARASAACGRAGRRAAAILGVGRSGIGRSPVPAADCAGRSRTGSARASRRRSGGDGRGDGAGERFAQQHEGWSLGARAARAPPVRHSLAAGRRGSERQWSARREAARTAGREQIARAVHAGQEYQRGHAGFRCGRGRIVAWRARHTRPIWMRRDPGICGAGVAGVECAGHADTIPEPP